MLLFLFLCSSIFKLLAEVHSLLSPLVFTWCPNCYHRIPHYLYLSSLLRFSWMWQFLKRSSSLISLMVLRSTDQVYYRTLSVTLYLFDVLFFFSWLDWDSFFFFSLPLIWHYTWGTYYHIIMNIDVDIDQLAEGLFIRFLHSKFIFSPSPPHLSILHSLKGNHYDAAHNEGVWSYVTLPLMWSIT